MMIMVIIVVRGLGPVGLGWVVGPQVHLAVGWVGLGQLFGGLGWVWVDEMDPWTTLIACTHCINAGYCLSVCLFVCLSVSVCGGHDRESCKNG